MNEADGPVPGESGGREALIDREAIARNIRTRRSMSGAERVLAVVAADAFGHGAVPVAHTAVSAGADALVVGTGDEARALRTAGVNVPIVTTRHHPADDYAIEADADASPVVRSREDAIAVIAAGVRTAHLMADLGGTTLGMPLDELARVAGLFADENISGTRVTGIMASAEPGTTSGAVDAVIRVVEGAGLHPTMVHLADDEPSLPGIRSGTIRMAADLYGLSALVGARPDLSPAMTLTAPVVGVKRVHKGAGVSYDYTFVAQHDTMTALVPMGYGDGLPRRSGNRVRVAVSGHSFPLIGRMAMDAHVLDIGPDSTVTIGDLATLIGSPADGAWTAADWADALDTTSLDIVSRLSKRVRRVVR